jgi:prolipoprotein diacylglyceryltransferase
MSAATITVGIDPTIELGPVTLAWHGLTIVLGIVAGGIVAAREAHGADWFQSRCTRWG